MNHPFIQSQADSTKCAKCHLTEIQHGNQATCDACPNIGPVEVFGTMALCNTCLKKEYDLAVKQAKEHSTDFDKSRINTAVTNPIGAILKSVETDQSLQIKEEFFNLETTSIIELNEACKAADLGPYKIAELLQARFQHFKSVLFDIGTAQVNLNSRMRALAVHLNEIATKLTNEEREQLKIRDLNYQPVAIPKKKDSTPKVKITAEEKMAQNLVRSSIAKVAAQLVMDKTASNLEEAEKIAVARGLTLKIEDARIKVRKALSGVA